MAVMFLSIATVLLFGVCLLLWTKVHSLEYDLDAALSAIAAQTKALSDLKNKHDEIKDRFDEIIAEAEKQNEREAQWNEGLNNILNYCLEDSFRAGGGKA